MNRREFLKICGAACITAGCATTKDYFGPDELIAYPPLKGDKVQPPANGCLIGFFSHYKVLRWTGVHGTDSARPIKSFEEQTGVRPASLIMYPHLSIFGTFPMEDAVIAAKLGVIPFIYAEVNPDQTKHGTGKKLDEIVAGVYDRGAKDFAKGAIEYGESYGGFFLTTMREPNIPQPWTPHTWGGQPRGYIKAWRHLWEVCEASGANRYITWVPSFYAGHGASHYYPGDQYVDWVGISCYLGGGFNRGTSLGIISTKYDEYKARKPVMLSELGVYRGNSGYLERAFKSIESMPNLRAVFPWNVFDFSIDTSYEFSSYSYQTLKNILKNPYFIGGNRRNR